jgi:ribosome-associated translation inhibitor RaiA
MKRIIELKHVGPKEHVKALLEDLIGRLEEKLNHFQPDAVSLHVLFEENGTHKLFRTALTCHVPGHTVAAHEEGRAAGETIRKAFAEVERQLEKQKAFLRREHLRRHRMSRQPTDVIGFFPVLWLALTNVAGGEEAPLPAPSSKAVEALQLVESKDPYQQQLGFLRLEALREAGTAPLIREYLTHRKPEMRAYALRALAAIEGAASVPTLLNALRTDKQALVRRAALLGLEPFHKADPDILPAFIKALRDRKTEVRMAAVDVVSRIDDPRAREAILLRNKRERRRDVRRVLSLAVRRLGQP